MASLFKQDDISYKLVPVGSYSELQVKRDEAFASEEVRTLFTWAAATSATRSSSTGHGS